MDGGSIAGYVAIALSAATAIVGVVNHKRVRSTCCGKSADLSIDIENTTPPQNKIDALVITAPK